MRRQLPVHSPLDFRTIATGFVAAASARAATQARSRLANALGSRRVVLTDSGTSALVLALRALVPRDGVVALPGWGCIDLSAAVELAGVQVRLYDLSPIDMGPDLDSLSRTLARGVDAVVVAHFHGYPADVAAVRTLAAPRGVRVIEDAAQRAGATLHDAPLGTFGDVAVLSFGRGKGTTGGGGGALLVNDPSLDSSMDDAERRLRSSPSGRILGATVAQWLLGRPALYALPASIPGLRLGEMVYHPAHEPGSIPDAAGAMALRSLVRDADEVRMRRGRAAMLEAQLHATSGLVAVQPIEGGEPGYLRFAVRATRHGVEPAPRLGVMRGYPMTLAEHPALRGALVAGERAGPGAHTLRNTLFTVPTHSLLSRRDDARITSWLSRYASRDDAMQEVQHA